MVISRLGHLDNITYIPPEEITLNTIGAWEDLSTKLDIVTNNIKANVKSIVQVCKAVALGDLTAKITVQVSQKF